MKQLPADFDWTQARAFLATAEEGSLSAAARRLGLTQPTLGRQVSALEARLGVALFERVGRALALTPTGKELLPHVQAMAEAANAVSLVASGRSQTMTGRVAVSVVDIVALSLLTPALRQIEAEAPGLTIELVVTDSLSDLRRREADIAIRHVRPEDPDLIARKVREGRAQLYATPEFRDRHGGLETLADLRGVPFVGFDTPEKMAAQLTAFGAPIDPSQFRLVAHNGHMGWHLVRSGFGVGVMIDEVARDCLDVVRVCPEFQPVPVPYWLTVHRELRMSARIRRVFDILAEALSA